MLVVGLTGGIGSGKTTFGRLLASKGAILIDADGIGRDALEPGQPAWHSVMDQFGDEILAAGSLDIDRRRLAAIVFADPAKLTALNAIVHPVISQSIADQLEELGGTNEIVILDAALIVETGLRDIVEVLIVVTADPASREKRLVLGRGFALSDAKARMAAQRPQEELIANADIVVTNDGAIADLDLKAEEVWARLQDRL